MTGPIRPGKLDRRVQILRRGGAVDDGFTRRPGDYAVLTERWASVKPRMGREGNEAGGREARTVMSFWMRWDEVTRTLTAQDALDLDGQRYELIALPIELGRREGVELLGIAGGAA